MKWTTILTVAIVFAASCLPTRTRRTTRTAGDYSDLYGKGNNQFQLGDNQSGRFPSSLVDDQQPGTAPPPQNHQSASTAHCMWSQDGHTGYSLSAPIFGQDSNGSGHNLNICQNREDDKIVYLQFKYLPDSNVCLYPMNRGNNGSVNIGPKTCVSIENRQPHMITLKKYTSQSYQNLEINAVLLLPNVLKTYKHHRIANQNILLYTHVAYETFCACLYVWDPALGRVRPAKTQQEIQMCNTANARINACASHFSNTGSHFLHNL